MGASGADADGELAEVPGTGPVPVVTTVTPSPPPSPSQTHSPLRRQRRDPIDLGFSVGPNWNADEPVKPATIDALRSVFDTADENGTHELGLSEFTKAFRELDPAMKEARVRVSEATQAWHKANEENTIGKANGGANGNCNGNGNDKGNANAVVADAMANIELGIITAALHQEVDARLKSLFAVIDTNAGDTIDFDEFSTHVLLTAKQLRDKARATAAPSKYELQNPKQKLFDKQTRHADLVTSIVRMKRVDQYATVSRDGTVRAWVVDESDRGDQKSKSKSQQSIPQIKLHKKIDTGLGYATGGVELPVTGRLAVACFDRSVRVFDPKNWTQAGAYRALHDVPLCIAGWCGGKRVARHGKDVDHVAVGDVGGNVHFLKVVDTTDGEKAERPGSSVRFEKPFSVSVHPNHWVTAICHVASENCLATGASDGTAALVSLDGNGSVRRRFTKNGHVKGINAVAWSDQRKILLTGSDDLSVKLWATLSEGPVGELRGHETSVLLILPIDSEQHVLTVSSDKTLKVWDLKTKRNLQTFVDEQEYHPENAIGGVCFDTKRRTLVIASVQPKVWQLQTNVRGHDDAHAVAVASCSFSKAFQRVVTADCDAVVCVWDVTDGDRVFRFNADNDVALDSGADATAGTGDTGEGGDSNEALIAAAGNGVGDGALEPPKVANLTAACLDRRGRRIVIGGGDGGVRAWNIANGNLCKDLVKDLGGGEAAGSGKHGGKTRGGKTHESINAVEKPVSSKDRLETQKVTGVCTIGEPPDLRFASVGWNRKVTLWDDTHDVRVETPRRVVSGHGHDVLCCAANDASTVVATGDFSGDVFVWSDMGERRARLVPPALPNDRDTSGDIDADGSGDDHHATAHRAAECLAFTSTRVNPHDPHHRGAGLQHTFLWVGYADGHVRCWDVKNGRLALDFHAGHRPGEALLSIAISECGGKLVSGDSVGRVKLWNVESAVQNMHVASWKEKEIEKEKPVPRTTEREKRPVAPKTPRSPLTRGDVECLGYWQAHASRTNVLTLTWFVVPGFGLFFVSGGEDAAAHLWSEHGQHVGRFGPDVWRLGDQWTWVSTVAPVGGDKALRDSLEAEAAEKRNAKEARRAAKAARLASTHPEGAVPGAVEGAAPPVTPSKRVGVAPSEPGESSPSGSSPSGSSSSESASTPGGRLSSGSSPTSSPTGSNESGSSLTGTESSPTSTVDSRTLPDPFPSPPGYRPVRPVEDRLLWTRRVKSSFENSGAYKEIKTLDNKKHPLRGADLHELRARSEKLSRKKQPWHTRVYLPTGDDHINKPLSRGRPYTSLHHLIHIADVSAIPKRPNAKLGRFKYGAPIKESPPRTKETRDGS